MSHFTGSSSPQKAAGEAPEDEGVCPCEARVPWCWLQGVSLSLLLLLQQSQPGIRHPFYPTLKLNWLKLFNCSSVGDKLRGDVCKQQQDFSEQVQHLSWRLVLAELRASVEMRMIYNFQPNKWITCILPIPLFVQDLEPAEPEVPGGEVRVRGDRGGQHQVRGQQSITDWEHNV